MFLHYTDQRVNSVQGYKTITRRLFENLQLNRQAHRPKNYKQNPPKFAGDAGNGSYCCVRILCTSAHFLHVHSSTEVPFQHQAKPETLNAGLLCKASMRLSRGMFRPKSRESYNSRLRPKIKKERKKKQLRGNIKRITNIKTRQRTSDGLRTSFGSLQYFSSGYGTTHNTAVQ